MNVYRLLFLIAVCITCVILQAKSEENADAREIDEEFEGASIREKRHLSYYRYHPLYFLFRRTCRSLRRSFFSISLRLVLKEVDCRENKRCQRVQKCLFGEVFVPPTPTPPPTPPMTSSSPTPMLTATPSSPVMPMSPTNMVSPTPASSSPSVASSV